MVPYLEMGVSHVFFCLGTVGSKGSLFRNEWFQCFSVQKLKVPKVSYLEMGGSNGFLLDRKSVVQGKSVDLGGRRIIKKKKKKQKRTEQTVRESTNNHQADLALDRHRLYKVYISTT